MFVHTMHAYRSVGTPAAMPPLVHWLMVQNVGRVSAVRTASLEPMAPHVVRPWESVTRWNTAVGIPLTALLTCTSRMAKSAATTSLTASLGCVAAMISNAVFTGDQVIPYTYNSFCAGVFRILICLSTRFLAYQCYRITILIKGDVSRFQRGSTV